MRSFSLLTSLMLVGAADPLGDSIIYRVVQGLATLGILGLVWKIATTKSKFEADLEKGIHSFRELTHRVNDHSDRIYEIDGKQEAPFNEYE